MPPDDLFRRGEHVMTVCNACRYCEQYCPVFPAMERRMTFAPGDLTFLANLCHNCGECLYACQYAPPHEFAINVPQTLARIRLRSYEQFCWPRFLAIAYRRNGLLTAAALVAGLVAVSVAIALATGGFGPARAALAPAQGGPYTQTFYDVLPHNAMVALFGGVSLFVLFAMIASVARFWRALPTRSGEPATWRTVALGIRDALTLRHLHGAGECTSAEEYRPAWRRRFHHFTVYGFLLCFASTSVAAIYEVGLGWLPPYGYTSLPVVLGTVGGVGLLIGPAGLLMMRRRRDPDLGDPAQRGLDSAFVALLLLSSATGLLLLVLRHSAAMSGLLVIHLAIVLALFVTLPYGKFMHGLYRAAALVKDAAEARLEPVTRH